MYGVVLAGGGARGAYEVGALSAILDENIKIGAVCGTSIGSINGALFAQGDFDKCLEIWKRITLTDVVDMTVFPDEKLLSAKNISAFMEEVRLNKGISLSPLERLLRGVVSEEKLLLSPIDFGLVTYSVTDNRIEELFKADIPKSKLVDYLMASSSLPGVRLKNIDDKVYLDGGVGDNKPINMLINKGYTDIISIDVGGVGIVRPYSLNGLNIIEVRCSSPIIGILEFDNKLISNTIKMGYLDAKRAIGKLSGSKYYLRTGDYSRARRNYSQDLLDGLERAAEIFAVDHLREYTVTSLARAVIKRYNENLLKADTEWTKIIKTPEILFTKVCSILFEANNESFSKITSAVLKKYSRAANSVCYFLRQL